MKIYVLIAKEIWDDASWVCGQAFRDRLDAEKEAHFLQEISKDEETGEVTYYRVKEIDLA